MKTLAHNILNTATAKGKIAALLLVITFLASCGNFKKTEEGALARVYDQTLYPSDLEGLVAGDVEPADSIMIVKAYIESWARDQMMLALAKKNLPDDLNIDRLVDNYRSELILNSYEEALLKKPGETKVSEEEVKTYYEENKEMYPLDKSIVRCIYVRIDRDAPKVTKIKSWWKYDKDEGIEEIKPYILENAEEHILDDSEWIPLSEIEEKLPKGALRKKNLRSSKTQIYLKDKNYRYYLIINEARLEKDPAPFDYIKEDMTRILMRKKRIAELENLTEDAYKREIEKQNIEIF